MDPTRRNLLASSGMFVSGAAMGGVSPVLAEQAAPNAVLANRLAGDYVDLREFGTITSDGNITDLLLAAKTVTHEKIIRIPWVGNASYRIDGMTLEPGTNLEFNCRKIKLGGTLVVQSGCSLRGVTPNAAGGILTGPLPGPQLWPVQARSASIDPLVKLNGHNILVDSLTIGGGFAVALLIEGSSCLTINNCALGGNPALRVNSSFWINLSNLQLQGGAAGYAAEFVTTINDVLSTGLVVARNLLIYGRGILIKPTYGSNGCSTLYFEDVASEGAPAASALFELDSSNGNLVENVTIVRPMTADPGNWGDTKDIYTLKNSGWKTANVHIIDDLNAWPKSVAPTSTPIKSFRMTGSRNKHPIVPIYATKWRKDFVDGGIDAKLVCTPHCGGQLVIGTPMPCEQDPALWPKDAGMTVTPNQRAPDGSMMAGLVSGPYGAGVRFGLVTNLQFSLNDWIIGGVWAKAGWDVDPSGMAVINMPPAYGGTGWSLNNYGSAIQSLELDGVGTNNGGWKWLTGAYKITAVGADTTPGLYFSGGGKGAAVTFFNPCWSWVKIADGYSDGDVVNAARAMKGGWSASITPGTAGLLDHQKLMIGGGVHIFSDEVSPATVSPPQTWKRGDICYNSLPSIGQPRGWVCTVAGTPGTWVAMANL